jgi:hypothetical protein
LQKKLANDFDSARRQFLIVGLSFIYNSILKNFSLANDARAFLNSLHRNPLQYSDGLDTDHQSMIRRLQFRIRKLIAAFLLAFAITPELRERR